MTQGKAEGLLRSFKAMSEQAEQQLRQLQEEIRAGRAPDMEAQNRFIMAAGQLRQQYQSIQQAAWEADGTQREGLSAEQYVELLRRSRQRVQENIRLTERFLQIRAKEQNYTQALAQVQRESQKLLRKLQEEEVKLSAQQEKLLEWQSCFLEVAALSDCRQGEALMERLTEGGIGAAALPVIQNGLFFRKYTLPEPTALESPEAAAIPTASESPEAAAIPTASESPEAAAIPTAEESPEAAAIPTAEESPEAAAFPTAEESPEAAAFPTVEEFPETSAVSTAKESPESAAESMAEESPETADLKPPEAAVQTSDAIPEAAESEIEYLPARKPFKRGKANTKSFKKELSGIFRFAPRRKFLLTLGLLSNMGATTAEQSAQMSMFWRGQFHVSPEQAEEFLQIMTEKGLAGAYDLQPGTAYCLTKSSYECMSKESISTLYRDIWVVKPGRSDFYAEEWIPEGELRNRILQNTALIAYLAAARKLTSSNERLEFRKILASVCWDGTHYRALFPAEEDIMQTIYPVGDDTAGGIHLLAALPESAEEGQIVCCEKFFFKWENGDWELLGSTEEEETAAEPQTPLEEAAAEPEAITELETTAESEPEEWLEEAVQTTLEDWPEPEPQAAQPGTPEPESLAAQPESREPESTAAEWQEIPSYAGASWPGVPAEAPGVDPAEPAAILSAEERGAVSAAVRQMLGADRIDCAAAFLKYKSLHFPELLPVYEQLAYAVNDPLAACYYSSRRVIDVYFQTETPFSEYFAFSAVLRSCFLDQCSYDYEMQPLRASLSSYGVFGSYPTLQHALYKLIEFKEEYGCGIDRCADYRKKEQAEIDRQIGLLRKTASEQYDHTFGGKIKEQAAQKRFLETKKRIFAPDGTLGICAQAMIEDDRAMLSDISEYLKETFLRDGCEVHSDNLDEAKFEKLVDENWDKAGEMIRNLHKSEKLKSSLRTNLLNSVEKVVRRLCDYVYLCGQFDSDGHGGAGEGYTKCQGPLLYDFNRAIEQLEECPAKDLAGLAGQRTLLYTLRELRSRLDGSYQENSSRYFYIDFLRGDQLLLDDDFHPVLDDVQGIPGFAFDQRIQAYIQSVGMDFRESFLHNVGGGDDLGSAGLILQYLRETHPESLEGLEQYHLEDFYSSQDQAAQQDFQKFLSDLELYQSYGKLDGTAEGTKERIIQNAEYWLDRTKETHNYGFFRKVLEQFRQKIQEDACGREAELIATVDDYLARNPVEGDPQRTRIMQEIRSRIRQQNYAAAEDLFNRMLLNDVEDLDTASVCGEPDYLTEFLDQYDWFYRDAGGSERKLSLGPQRSSRPAKDQKAASRLAENWLPNGAPVSEERLGRLLGGLGFAVESLARRPGKYEQFTVRLQKPSNGFESNYKHPIAAFGSQAESDGFRVLCLFGSYNPESLVDTFKDVDSSMHTLVLLDFRLSQADRRELAFRLKTGFHQRIFGVIDRVLFMYLLQNGSPNTINRRLMAVMMPFAAYQPYVAESAVRMPPEIFIGRKNELQKIEDADGASLVYGGRQLGKSALLKRARSDIDKNLSGDRAVYVDIKDMDYRQAARRVSQELSDTGVFETEFITEDWNELARAIKKRINRQEERIPYLLLLMDEADSFIESCAEINYLPFRELKDVQSNEGGTGKFKFVAAGLHNVTRFHRETARAGNSVLPHYESLTVKPFKSAEARELLEIPLRYLGFRFPKESDALVSMILGTTNYFPGLLQYYCSKLIEALYRKDYAGYNQREAPPYIIKEDHIKRVLAEDGLKNQIREKFIMTLEVDNDRYYYLIALLIAYRYHMEKRQSGCSPREVLETARELGLRKLTACQEDQIETLMDEMRELNILQHTGDRKYLFTRHNFLEMMGSSESIENELLNSMEP